MADSSDITIADPPDDGISSMEFGPTSNLLLVSSWDSQVRLYDVDSNTVKSSIRFRAAALTCTFDPDPKYAYGGGLDTWVRRMDLHTEEEVVLGAHDATVSSIVYSKATNQLVSGSWDRTIKMWDPRRGHPRSLIGTYDAPERVHGLDLVDNTLLVTTSGRRFATYDLRNMGAPLENRTSLLKFNTVRAAMMPSGEGFTAGSIEGRVSVEYFDPSPEVQKNKYAFKCHRQPTPKGELVYPINALAFHPKYGTMVTAGSDGALAVWDFRAKKRIKLYDRQPTAISAVAFSKDGTRLAVASSGMCDASSVEKRREMKDMGDDPDHISITIKSVGEELKSRYAK